MAVKNLDILESKKQEILQLMHEAMQQDDLKAFDKNFMQLCENIQESVLEQARSEIRQSKDTTVLATRGVRQLTTRETEYYQAVMDAMRSPNPKQALGNLDVVMPETIIDSVFDDLETNHPLLSKIQFTSVTGLTRMMMNTNGFQKAAWGKLTDKIIKELESGFKEVDVTQDKLSAFIPISKAMLDLGPQWLDNYIRTILYEALANGLEEGIVNGTGKDQPIGMTKQVGDNVSVVSGVYPDKAVVKITKFDNIQLNKQAAVLALNEKGQPRTVSDLILLVNPSDYYSKVLPAVQYPAPGGGYVSALPFDISIMQSAAVPKGKAVFGMARLYFMGAGMGNQGNILYSDEYHFLEDERVYLIKMYAHGFPIDNNAFIVFDISKLQPAYYKVETVTNTADTDDATLADLKFSNKKFAETFAAGTKAYTVTTTDSGNTITALPADATADVEIEFKDKKYPNGTKLTWDSGSNTVKVIVTDGTATETYTITVTKE